MKKTNKKGFTIVELVIVIAVIAILAAVLIPNISRLVRKANASADESLVRNLNTALRMDTEKHTTMTAALEAAYENGGFDVAKIVTKNKDNKILWDSVNDCFVYLNGGERVYLPNTQTNKDVKDWNFFEIVDKVPALNDQKYSIYLTDGATIEETVTVKVGFDAGKNTVNTLKYENKGEKKDVIINTNGGALEVDAPLDEVYRYGVAQSVKITEVAPSSYHEYGKVIGDVVIIKGRIELAASAEVSTIFVSSKNTNDVKIDVVSGATVGTVAPTTDVAKADIDAATTIPADAKLNEVINVTTDFAGGLGTERSPYLIATAEQFVKIGNFSDDMKTGNAKFFTIIADLILDAKADLNNKPIAGYFCGQIDGENHNITIKNSDDKTEQILYLYPVGTAKVTDVNFHITSGYIVTLTYGWSNGKTIFDNVNFGSKDDNGMIEASDNNKGFYVNFVSGGAEFIDCTNYYSLFSNDAERYAAVFIGGFMNPAAKVSFVNCVNYGNVTMDYAGLFFGNGQGCNSSNLTVKNCSNYGNVIGTIASSALGGKNPKPALSEIVTNGLSGAENFRVLSSEGLTILTENDHLVITKLNNTDAAKYVVSFTVWATVYDKNGNKWGTRFTSISVDLGNIQFENGKYITELYSYKMVDKDTYTKDEAHVIGSDVKWMTNDSDNLKYFFDNENRMIVVDYTNVELTTAQQEITKFVANGTARVQVNVFNADGELLAAKSK